MIPPEAVPRIPPSPPTINEVSIGPAPASSRPPVASATPPPPASPSLPQTRATIPPKKRKTGRLWRFFTSLFLLTGFSYALGVYYSLVSDNFHDFFTEYIPFGEDAVLYFEEHQVGQRLRSTSSRNTLNPTRELGKIVTIPGGSGVSSRIVSNESRGSTHLGTRGPHNSAIRDNSQPTPQVNEANLPSPKATDESEVAIALKVPGGSSRSISEPPDVTGTLEAKKSISTERTEPVAEQRALTLTKQNPPPEMVTFAPSFPPIEPLELPKTEEEPIIQDMVRMINGIIATVNADHASGRYSPAIESAKSIIAQIRTRIVAMKEHAADEKIRATHEEFDQAATELVRRLEDEMRDQEARWQDDFESERKKIAQSYQEKLSAELKQTQANYEQRLRNELLEQAIKLKRQFAVDVQERVEEERNGRLGKLKELSQSVDQLEDLTTGWNDVVDANMNTQHLIVAVEAVRSVLEDASQPRPFIRELAALRECASGDTVIKAAIGSIDPVTYRYGISSSAQLIDRFRRVASEVRKASLLPSHAGAASHAASVILSKALFRKQGLALGDDVESVLTRTETMLEEGNLDGAAREMNSLTGWAKTLSKDWLAEVRKVLEVHQALDVSL